MTSTELALFKEIIKECVREVVKEEFVKEQKELKKDLLLIKRLIAKNIQESRKTTTSPVKTNRNILAEQARKIVAEEQEIIGETSEGRSWEDTESGLYRLFGGKDGFDKMTKASVPLIDGTNNPNRQQVPTGNMNSINSVLADTMRTMTNEDAAYVAQGIQEARRIAPQLPVTPAPIQQVQDEESYNNDSLPDFDIDSILQKRRK